MQLSDCAVEVFQQSEILAGLTPEQGGAMLRCGRRRECRAGETLFSQGEPADCCYLVIAGRFKLSKVHEQGREVLLRYLGPGELTAAVAVFNGKDYPVSAQAVSDAAVVGWSKATMLQLMLTHGPLAVNMLAAAIDRLDDLQTRFLELCAEQVERRVAHGLLRIMRQAGIKTEEGILIDLRLSRQELADYSGTTLYTVSRILSSWEKSGWVASGRERIVVTDPHSLVVFAEI